MRQNQKSLAPPPSESGALKAFPSFELAPTQRLYRVGRENRSPWWFGSSGAGRFDLSEPDGTCYLAGDVVAALLEVIGPDREGGFVTTEHFATRRLFELRVPETRHLADLASTRAAALGVTLEIHTTVPYDLPQQWAERLRAEGFDGLRYLLRHDPAGEDGFALFGPAGAREDWPIDHTSPIGADLLQELESATGLKVAPIPHSRQLDRA